MTPITRHGATDGRRILAIASVLLMVLCCMPVPTATAGEAGGSTPTSKYMVITTVDPADPYYAAALELQDFRNAGPIVKFDPQDLDPLMATLKAENPRYVAVVLKPTEIHINFTRQFLMMATFLDDDPFSDFSYGFITGATGADALAFVQNIETAETTGIADYPLNWSGFAASSINAVYTFPMGFEADIGVDDYSMIYSEANDTGAGLDYYLANDQLMEGSKILDIGNNGDPHMTWLFEGGNFDPNPPSWPYDPAKVEDPAYARVGITSDNISALDLYPAVVYNGACHSGETKVVMVESDIEATFGDTNGVRKFYTMSDNFSFALSILNTNITGYFAPVGANNANEKGEELYNTFAYDEPLGDTHKRTVDGVVMGFLGNRPSLRLYQADESMYLDDLYASGTFDPNDWPSAEAMLGGKANRVYFGDPLFDPFKNEKTDAIRWTNYTTTPINETTLKVDIATNKPAGFEATYWDKFHYSKTRIYVPITLPSGYENVTSVKVSSSSGPMDQIIHAIEWFNGSTILHIEVDTQNDIFQALDFDVSLLVTVPEPPHYGVDIVGPNRTGMAMPGASRTYDIVIKNTGNIDDNITLSNTSLPTGWTLNVTFNGTGLASGEEANAVIKVSAPLDAFADTNASVILTATSDGNASIGDTMNLTTTVGAYYGVNIEGASLTGRTLPGVPKCYDVYIDNLGNDWDTFNVTYQFLTPDLDVRLDNATIEIGPKAVGNVQICIRLPDYLLAGDVGKILLTVTSKANVTKSDELPITTFMDPFYAFDLVNEDEEVWVAPGKSWVVNLTFKNLGNTIDSIELTANQPPSGWNIQFNNTRLTIPANTTWLANVTITASPQALANERAVFQIIANSTGDLLLNDSVTYTIKVRSVVSFLFLPPADRSEAPGTPAVYLFEVQNQGNIEDNYTMTVVSARNWPLKYLKGNATGPVQPWTKANVTVQVTVPAGTAAYMTDILTVTVVSGLNNSMRSGTTVKTTVLPVFSIVMTVDQSTREIKAGEDAPFTFTVTNRGNLAISVTMQVEITGDQESVSWVTLSASTFQLVPNETRTVVLTVDTPISAKKGNYTFNVVAQSMNAYQSVPATVVVKKVTRENTNATVRMLLAAGLLLLLIVAVIAFYLFRKHEDEEKASRKARGGKDEEERTVSEDEEE